MKRAFKVFLLTILAGGAFAAGVGHQMYQYPDRPQGSGAPTAVTIPKGASLTAVVGALEHAGVVAKPLWFRVYANQRGVAGKIKAGRYTLSSAMTPRQLVDHLVAGAREDEKQVTIPEGKQILEVAELLGEAGICSAAEAARVARDPQVAQELGVPGPTLEGYLFPDTYKFRPQTAPKRVFAAMVKHGKQVFSELRTTHAAGVTDLARTYGFGDREIVILASIVEKETAAKDERPRIASVFLNRLRLPTFKPKLLQTDPTIVYGCTVPEPKSDACSRFQGRIRRIHLDDKNNPYNTYTHEGLPPGPIANPGRASLAAVMAPESSSYLYFVSRNDGTHVFSSTKEEHEAAVTRYQRGGAEPATAQ